MLMLSGKRESDEAQNREQWEQARFVALKMMSLFTKKGKVLKMSDVAVFHWDKKTSAPITDEERKAAFEAARALQKKKVVESKPLTMNRFGKIK